ncbi:MAG: nucleotidyltransferase [Meiothermus sp.]
MAILSLPDLRAKREAILALAAKHGASNVRVFGSLARSQADEASGVDSLVTLEPGRGLWDLGEPIAGLEDLLRCKVDVAPENWLRPKVLERAIRDATSL